MRYRTLLLVSALLLSSHIVLAQQFALSSTKLGRGAGNTQPVYQHFLITKQVNEVNLVLGVLDKKGHFVTNLPPDSFAILDNDRPQKNITFFQKQTDLPLDIAIVLDTSGSVGTRYEAERSSITCFLRQTIRHDDSVMIFAFNQGIRAISPVKYNWRDVSKRLRAIKPDGETALYDTISAAGKWLSDDPRSARRIIIVVSDGEENASKANLSDTVSSVLQAGATVYTINAGDDLDTPAGKQGEEVLKALSDLSGGNYLKASFSGDTGSAFSTIRRELRSQYVLAYKPSGLRGNKFHRVTVVAKGLRVRCRLGYYVP